MRRSAPPRPARQIEPRDSTGGGRLAPARRVNPRRLQAISSAKLVEIALPAISPQPGDARLEPGPVLAARHIATPRPLAVCEPRGDWLFRSSYLATEWIAGGENLHLYGWRLAGWPLPERLREASFCAARLGRLVGQMHAAGISHRDLKAANLLAVRRGDDLAVYLVNTDGVRIGRRPGARRRAAELARLAIALEAHPWVTRSICCRFLRAYAAQFRREPSPGNASGATLSAVPAAPYGASIIAESKCCRTSGQRSIHPPSCVPLAPDPWPPAPGPFFTTLLPRPAIRAAPPGCARRRGRKCRCGRPTSLGIGRRQPGPATCLAYLLPPPERRRR